MWRRKPVEQRELRRHREIFQRRALAAARQPQPVMLERDGVQPGADAAEALEIPFSRRMPVPELRSQPVGSPRGAHQRVFVRAQQGQQAMQARHGRDGAIDSVVIAQFEQRYVACITENAPQCGRDETAADASAHDRNAA